jgi:DNA repair protein RadC
LTALLKPFRQHSAHADAARAIATFGSLPAILAQDCDDLALVLQDRVAAEHLTAIKTFMAQALRSDFHGRPIISGYAGLLAYLRVTMGGASEEEVRVLFLDADNHVLREQVMSRGTVLSAPLNPRKIMQVALNLGATALILVHNHPSGTPEPSTHDILVTRRLVSTAQPLEITVHDHLIVTRSSVTSLRARGLI